MGRGLRTRLALTIAVAMAITAAVSALVAAALTTSVTSTVTVNQGASEAVTTSGGAAGGYTVWIVAAIVAAVAAAIALPFGWALAERPMRRVEIMALAAAAITPERPDARLPVDARRDEIDAAAVGVNRALDRLAEATAAQDRFIANASHELRTPLATVRTALEAPLDQGRIPEDLSGDIGRALAAARRAEEIITALLRLARVSAPIGDLRTVQVGKLLREVAEAYREDAESAGRSIDIAVDDAPVRTDPTLLGQAAANLVDNALRHGAGTVTVRGEAVEGGYRVHVGSAGPPYSAAEAARLVEPFHRGPHTRLDGEGSGLGLAIVDSIARRLGGRLVVAPRPGGGLDLEIRVSGGRP